MLDTTEVGVIQGIPKLRHVGPADRNGGNTMLLKSVFKCSMCVLLSGVFSSPSFAISQEIYEEMHALFREYVWFKNATPLEATLPYSARKKIMDIAANKIASRSDAAASFLVFKNSYLYAYNSKSGNQSFVLNIYNDRHESSQTIVDPVRFALGFSVMGDGGSMFSNFKRLNARYEAAEESLKTCAVSHDVFPRDANPTPHELYRETKKTSFCASDLEDLEILSSVLDAELGRCEAAIEGGQQT